MALLSHFPIDRTGSREGIHIETKTQVQLAALLIALAPLIHFLLVPTAAQAYSLWDFAAVAVRSTAQAAQGSQNIHSWSTPVLRAATNVDPNPAKGGGDILTVDGVALVAEVGPEGTNADILNSSASNGQISLYVVRNGDTLSSIAQAYGVTANTILWANDLKNARDIHPGDQLVILPISGIKHTVQKGETLAGIVKKYKGDLTEVSEFNGLDGSPLAVGTEIIIPFGVEVAPTVQVVPSAQVRSAGGPEIAGYFMRPVAGGRKSQGIHGYNGIDIAIPIGTKVIASADGVVVVARGYGWNGGYGQYVVIAHPNGTQTVYAHLSQVSVSTGVQVIQGQQIGLSGNTGRSTGAHLHFEVRGAKNPF